jgi:hypothetical protein
MLYDKVAAAMTEQHVVSRGSSASVPMTIPVLRDQLAGPDFGVHFYPDDGGVFAKLAAHDFTMS